MRHAIGAGLPALLWMVTLGAAPSDVADAVMTGDLTRVRALIEQQADVNAPQADGATALHWAAYRDDLETANLLIGAGADVAVANRAGVTPLSLASLAPARRWSGGCWTRAPTRTNGCPTATPP